MKKSKSKLPLVIGVIGVVAVSGLGYYVAQAPRPAQQTETHAAEKQDKKPADVKVLTPKYDKGDLKLDSKKVTVTPGEDPKVQAVNGYLAQLTMLPKGAVLKACQISDGVATLDFSNEFETTYGTEDEQTILKGILTTMGQFPEVKQVKLTVGGRTLETLGNVDLTLPQDVIH